MRKIIAAGVAAALGLVSLAPVAADASTTPPTLADILLSDSATDGPDGFDRRNNDYDIVTQAVLLFPDLVDAASNPDAELTVFLPTDGAFRRLVKDLTGTWHNSEADVFGAVAGLGTETVKNVLLYHIVPASIPYSAALQADGVELDTLLPEGSITVEVMRGWPRISLTDADTDDRDPRVTRPNVGGAAANGYAHGIDRVLRPILLP